jgi:hypothetical protein
MRESEISKRIRVRASRLGWRLFTNVIGLAWVGIPSRVPGADAVLLQRARRVRFGLCPGSADLIGYKLVTITPEMVGSILPVFAAIEVKTPTGRVKPEQEQFLFMVNAAGGYGKVVRAVEDL